MTNKPFILHIGAGPFHYEWAENSDKDTFDITQKWPIPDNKVDAITSMHVLQCLTARELAVALTEAYRVLKVGGVMRLGVPIIESKRPLSQLLGWSNVTIFSKDLLFHLFKQVGFTDFEECKFKESTSIYKDMLEADNRPEETYYFEAYK